MKHVALTCALYSALTLFNCKDKNGHLDPKLADGNITKFVKSGPLQVAFDFMAMPFHVQMMKAMKSPMRHVEGATHGLMVTIMVDKTKQLVTDASVSISVRGPDGKKTSHKTEVMSGKSMHHYAVHLNASRNGSYEIEAKINYKGREYSAKTNFGGSK